MDHDYELEEDYAPRVLWGRIAFFVLALILAFAVGRCTKSAGVSETAFQAEQQKVQDLASENAVLQQQLESAPPPDEGGGEGENGGGGNEDAGGGEEQATEQAEEPVGDGERYTVESGDTLTKIAEKFYGDPRKFDLIVDANNLDSSTNLRVGQELIIPADE